MRKPVLAATFNPEGTLDEKGARISSPPEDDNEDLDGSLPYDHVDVVDFLERYYDSATD